MFKMLLWARLPGAEGERGAVPCGDIGPCAAARPCPGACEGGSIAALNCVPAPGVKCLKRSSKGAFLLHLGRVCKEFWLNNLVLRVSVVLGD